ncbi:TAT-variant-translocated molybdopterin oxidoreductase [Luteibacter sp. 3190]|uniref:TAT-variant-translocated molybdopterin oxidoreductase n=1 Tax=Luteibacter sp. 3190 TaxID=2817736 RepID=UPI0028566527|nr:TAT-variant-translocated molybdopterin oxidoreductase [Luteibacter sp. 3190]MDR6936489.1 molybdopterin-containing oxidoreductase family iron-sulfur binding subunit [Luteibacter sp. 3190]
MTELRDALPAPGSPRFWPSLDELVADPSRRPLIAEAFPQLADIEPSLDRRGFLRLLGASIAFAGLAACSGPPPERIVPQVGGADDAPPETARYATALATGGDVVGVLVELRDGRPIKVDGNPRHPASHGGSDARMQASILDLWDPARSQAPRTNGAPASWSAFEADMATLRSRFASGGDGLRVLSGGIDSPTLARQRDALLARYPQARWHVHEPAAGRPTDSWPDLAKARVIVTLDADILGTLPGHVRHARDFAAGRADPAEMSRLYAIEPSPSLTGRNADHAWPVAAADIATIATALAAATGVDVAVPALDAATRERVDIIANDLRAHAGAGAVLAGPRVANDVHALVRAINDGLGNSGSVLRDLARDDQATDTTSALIEDMRAGRVDTLVILDANPVMTAPGFAAALPGARRVAHLGRYRDETAEAAHWHLPALHPFETWSDLRSVEGTASIVQPIVAPLVDGRSAHDVIDLLLGDASDDPLTRVRATWRAFDDEAWTEALRTGVVDASLAPVSRPPSNVASVAGTPAMADARELEVVFRPDDHLWDGRHAQNAWLQELPRPVTTLAWENAAWLSPELARERGLRDGDMVRIESKGRSLDAPVLVVPGQATRTITLTLGYGRRHGIAKGHGHDAYALRDGDGAWSSGDVRLTRLDGRSSLALTQAHQDMGRRDVVRSGTPDRLPAYPPPEPHASLYPEKPGGDYRWGMSIDLNACIGCNACTIACQAENNIPVVGRDEVARGRRMHWIRVDRYHEGAASAPRTYHQPVPCMHCEHAPCEVVCPVEATVHDREGLNLQVYNRCIGTRFCSNNCPYKVRRFNFLQYADFANESLKAMRNPEVTARARGVMEKCTYCVQRIQRAHIAADRDGQPIARDAVTTACQDACPTRAIVFGDRGDDASAVARASDSPRRYALLDELGTRPRTTYLAALRNPAPDWRDA